MNVARQTLAIVAAAGVVLALLPPLAAQTDRAAAKGAQANAPPAPQRPRPHAKQAPPVPAKQLFGAVDTPAPLAARAIGFYARGCLAGAKALPVDGPSWQAMRLSRNRMWGHPDLVNLVERLGQDARAHDGWPGLLVGDMSQPRGGPMLTGHASHQVGLDADIWLTPMPDRRLSQRERENLSATSMLASDGLSVNPSVWTPAHVRLIRRAASYPETERIFVHPAIKKALCEQAGDDRAFLHKVRPYWGHYYHMHIRIACPKGSTNCQSQPPSPPGDGCGKELDQWFALLKRPAPKPSRRPVKPRKPKPPMTLAQLPDECRQVLEVGRPPELTAETKGTRQRASAPAQAPKKQ